MAKKKPAGKKAVKKASKKKPSSETSKKRATTDKKTIAVMVTCPSCKAPINLAGSGYLGAARVAALQARGGCTLLEQVECDECSNTLEVVKKGAKLGLSIYLSDID
jgi:hypothetical protein